MQHWNEGRYSWMLLHTSGLSNIMSQSTSVTRQIVSPWIHKSGWQLCVQQAPPVSQAITCLHFSTFLYFQKELGYSFKGRGWTQQGNECRKLLIPHADNWTNAPVSLLACSCTLALSLTLQRHWQPPPWVPQPEGCSHTL